MATAHLVIKFKFTAHGACVEGFDIYSEWPVTQYNDGTCFAKVMSAVGDDFATAKATLIELIACAPYLRRALTWVER